MVMPLTAVIASIAATTMAELLDRPEAMGTLPLTATSMPRSRRPRWVYCW